MPVALTNPAPGGRRLVTDTLAARLGPTFDAVIVYDIAPPVVTGSGASTTATDRSAADSTAEVTVEVLLTALRSDDVDVTVAVSVRLADSLGALTTIEIVGAAPTMSDARLHDTTWPACWQLHPLPLAPMN